MARIRLTGKLLILNGKKYLISSTEKISKGDKFYVSKANCIDICDFEDYGLIYFTRNTPSVTHEELTEPISYCSKILASEDDGIIIGNLLRGLKKENGDKIGIICNINEIL